MLHFSLTVAPQEVDLLLAALAELPLKTSVNLFMKIKAQRDEALTPKPIAKPEGAA